MKMLGYLRQALSYVGTDGGELSRTRNWREALINAGIVAGFNFFTTLAGISVTQIIQDPVKALVASVISAGLGFFARLMVERGIKK